MVPALSAQQQQRQRFYRGYVPLKRVTCAFPRLNVFMFVSVPPQGCVFCHSDEVWGKYGPTYNPPAKTQALKHCIMPQCAHTDIMLTGKLRLTLFRSRCLKEQSC